MHIQTHLTQNTVLTNDKNSEWCSYFYNEDSHWHADLKKKCNANNIPPWISIGERSIITLMMSVIAFACTYRHMYYAIHKHCVVHGCEHAFTCMANTYLMECFTVLHPAADNGIDAWPCKTLNFSIKKKLGCCHWFFIFFFPSRCGFCF